MCFIVLKYWQKIKIIVPRYLGRGGSDGCAIPMNVERLNTLGVIQVECGAQFSLALTRDGEVSNTS